MAVLPVAAPCQTLGGPAIADRGIGLETTGGVVLSSGALAAVADPGFSVGAGVSASLSRHVNVRVDAGLGLPDRDVPAGPLLDIYSGLASLEYVAQQGKPGRRPLRTAISLGAGLTSVEAAEMPAAAPAGAAFSETYLTLSAGARLGYPVTSGFVVFVSPRVKWLDLPAEDWNLLTAGLNAPAPDNVWLVPLRAGVRVGL